MKMKDFIYIDDLSNRGDFDDWYNSVMAWHYDNKSFDELDDEEKLYICQWFEKDYLER